jgi:hypothetical protein
MEFQDMGHPTWHLSGCTAEGCPVDKTHIVSGPSVTLLYLDQQWRGCGRCPDRLLLSGGDCVAFDS